ncbi:DUF3048 C-terminal domain-containing protein [uncultured Jatrophihabitans sp.]|uniref:DUF3048 domain-containing protein n=1 Tax=uncultured Jatrophihabitans sp. TaxID=1610747 RepID=UPI0035C949A6
MTTSRHLRRLACVSASLTVLLGVAAGCSGSHKKVAATKPVPTTTSAAPTTPSTTSAAPKPVPRNPLTGLPGVPKSPLLAVKIDDTAPGRPQVGIDKADVVYIEAVEAGLTRLAALYGTNKPTVGYVRSTRPADPDIMRQYGPITEVFSGGQKVSRTILSKAGVHRFDQDDGYPFFYRVDRSASDYINVEIDLKSVAKRVKTPAPKSNGWTFNPSLAGLTTSAAPVMNTVVTGTYSTGTAVSFRWDAKLGRYVRYIDGVRQHAADGNAITATNVIVQSCKVVSFPADKDVNGNPAQLTYTVGSGKVAVFRQGRRIEGTWSRSNATSGTTLRTSTGKPLPLNPGNTWVVLVRNGIPVHS